MSNKTLITGLNARELCAGSTRLELPSGDFFNEIAERGDKEPLLDLLETLGSGLRKKRYEVNFAAVGSSTYSSVYWEAIRRFLEEKKVPIRNKRRKDPNTINFRVLKQAYKELDIRVLPKERGIPAPVLQELSYQVLTQSNHQSWMSDMTPMGWELVECPDSLEGNFYVPHPILAEKHYSITTSFKNGRVVSLIFGNNGDCLSLGQFLEIERAENNPFALLKKVA
jgi:hypothetical protein